MKTIVLDPGHGGADPGATGNGLLEKHVNLELALGLAEKLKNYDAKILLTRTGDYRLDERAELDRQERAYMANRADADLFYSIHRRAERAQSKRGCKKVVPGKGGLYSSLLLILLGWADDLYSFSFLSLAA